MILFKNKIIENAINSIKKRNILKRYFWLTFSLFLSAAAFNLLQFPTKIVSGGLSGIAIVTNTLFGLNPSIVIFIMSIAFLVFSFIILGTEKTAAAFYSAFVYPFFINLTETIQLYIKVDTSDLLLISIFLGIIGGITSGIIYKTGLSNGGFNTVSQILYKKKKISISKTSFMLNSLVVLAGGFVFGYTNVLYAVIILYISKIVTDKVLLGISKNKTFYIITEKENEVKSYIIDDLKCRATVFKVIGGYQGTKKEVIMTVISNRDYFRLTRGVKEIDKDSFFVVTDAYETSLK